MTAARVYAGTSGYSYREWKGSFFPKDLPQTGFLAFYAERFPTVEINNTFYRFPSRSAIEQWRSETPESFRFAIKANQRITHRQRLKDVEEVTGSFVERCRLMEERLGPLLFQLPPQLKRDDERLERFLAALPPSGKYAVEFRHASWFEDPVLETLRNAGVALVQSEDDKLEAPRTATADFCYIRLRKDRYSPKDLEGWRSRIEAEIADGRDVFVYLKHDESGTSPEPTLRALEGK